jgi:hypothetical protein
MTVTSSTIAIVSGGRIPSMTSDQFNYYSPIALAMLDKDNPGLPAVIYDRCHALLVCHLYTADVKGRLEYKSENVAGDWSYTRDPGLTTYLMQYRQIVEDYQAFAVLPAEGVDRCDAAMDDLALDGVTQPDYSEMEDDVL